MKKPSVPESRVYDYDWRTDDETPNTSELPVKDLRSRLPDEIDLTRAPDESVPVVLSRPDDPDGAAGDDALRENIDGFPELRVHGPLRDYKNDPKYASSPQNPDGVRVLVGTAVLALLSTICLSVAYNVSRSFGDDEDQNSDSMAPMAPSLERTGDPDAVSSPHDIYLRNDGVSPVSSVVLPDDASRVSSLPTKPVVMVKISKRKNAKTSVVDLEDRQNLTPDEIRQLNEQRELFHLERKVLFDAEEEERRERERQKALEEGRPTEQDWE